MAVKIISLGDVMTDISYILLIYFFIMVVITILKNFLYELFYNSLKEKKLKEKRAEEAAKLEAARNLRSKKASSQIFYEMKPYKKRF